ncbi:MAG: hypothetical protein IBX61_00950 [Thermoleophilia bacterium]|nr:hypothetical protein [Thermoleophilia bacterium]
MLAAGLFLGVPTADIHPGDGHAAVALGSPLKISSSPFARIGKIAVYADGQLLDMEYNLGTGDLTRDLEIRPGQQVRVEAKVASLIGLTREFTSTFTTVPPLKIESMRVDGVPYAPGDRIPPQPTLAFFFSKPVIEAAVSLDGSEPIELEIDPDDATLATFHPVVSYRQGATYVLDITATAVDTATLEPLQVRASVVPPLSLYGRVEEGDGGVIIELNANTPFADPEAVMAALETNLPGAGISVERQRIIISCPGLDPGSEYDIKLASADGANGSFLEAPLAMTLSFKAQPAPSAGGYVSTGFYTGYVYNAGGPGTGASVAAQAGPESGPPPGWPDCCPWPPQ